MASVLTVEPPRRNPPATVTGGLIRSENLPSPAGERMAAETRHARPVAISAVIIRATAIIRSTAIIWACAVVDRAAAVITVIVVIIGPTVLGRGDGKTCADNAGKGGGRGGTAAPVVSAAGAEVNGAPGCGSGPQAPASWR